MFTYFIDIPFLICKGKVLKDYKDSNLLALKREKSLQFYNKVLLFHSAKLKVLSNLIENPDGFKEVYKEKPGDLLFSDNMHLCHRQYKR